MVFMAAVVFEEWSAQMLNTPDPKRGGRTEHFRFDLRDKVLVREVQRPGVVESLMIDFLGVQYRVAYWDNGDRKTVWLSDDELESRKSD